MLSVYSYLCTIQNTSIGSSKISTRRRLLLRESTGRASQTDFSVFSSAQQIQWSWCPADEVRKHLRSPKCSRSLSVLVSDKPPVDRRREGLLPRRHEQERLAADRRAQENLPDSLSSATSGKSEHALASIGVDVTTLWSASVDLGQLDIVMRSGPVLSVSGVHL